MANTYLGAEVALVDDFVTGRFAQASIVTALNAISAGLATRIYGDLAPTDAVYPFIVFQCQSPPRDIRGVGVVRVMVDTLYVVKAVAQTTSYAPLVGVAKVIDQAMTAPDVVAVGDGFVLSSVREDQFQLVEVDSGKQFRHLGGQFRIQAQAQQ